MVRPDMTTEDKDVDEDDTDAKDEADAQEEPAPAAPAKKKAAPAPAPRETAPAEDEDREDAGVIRRARPGGTQRAASPAPAGGVGKSMFVFILIFGVLAIGFFALSSSDPFSANNKPKWALNKPVSIDLTLDPKDDAKLACAAPASVANRHCEFSDKGKKFEGETEDKMLLRPYTTVDGQQLLAAGLWSQPELDKAKRPSERFTVKCNYTPEGFVKNPLVRWDPIGAWNEQTREWHAGIVTDCKVGNSN
jgi:hypothetical protein